MMACPTTTPAPADSPAGPGRQQPAKTGCGRGKQGAPNIEAQGAQHNATPAQRVRQCSVQQEHRRIAEHVYAERELHGFLGYAELALQRAEGWQVGVDAGGCDAGQQPQHYHHERI